MKSIVEFFIKRPIWGNAIIGIVVMAGLFSLFNLKRSFFPEIDLEIWKEVAREDHYKDEKHAYDYSFITYEKKILNKYL